MNTLKGQTKKDLYKQRIRINLHEVYLTYEGYATREGNVYFGYDKKFRLYSFEFSYIRYLDPTHYIGLELSHNWKLPDNTIETVMNTIRALSREDVKKKIREYYSPVFDVTFWR